MPLYRYKCNDCNEVFEKIMSLSERYKDKVVIVCPDCGSEENSSLMSRTSFTLKGSGWYKDGYQKSGGKNETN